MNSIVVNFLFLIICLTINHFFCYFRLFSIVVMAVAISLSTLLIYEYEEHYWLFPVFVLINIFLSWILLKEIILKSFLFSYGQNFITSRELQSLNE